MVNFYMNDLILYIFLKNTTYFCKFLKETFNNNDKRKGKIVILYSVVPYQYESMTQQIWIVYLVLSTNTLYHFFPLIIYTRHIILKMHSAFDLFLFVL